MENISLSKAERSFSICSVSLAEKLNREELLQLCYSSPTTAPGTSQWLPLLHWAPVSGAVPFTPAAAGTMEMPE